MVTGDSGSVSGPPAALAGATRSLRVEVVRSAVGLARLERPWREIFAEADDLPVFLSWEWMSAWWRHHDGRWKPHVLVALDGHDDVVGIAPLALRRRWLGPVPVRAIRLFANEGAYGSHLDIIAEAGVRPDVAAAFVSDLWERRREWDVLDVADLDSSSALRDAVDSLPGRHTVLPGRPAPYIRLAGDWDEFRSRLRKKVRRNLRYFGKLLESEHPEGIEFRLVSEDAELDDAMKTLVRMHENRRCDSAFEVPSFVAFHRDFGRQALAAGWLRFYVMKVGDVPVAEMYCLRRGPVVAAYQIGFDTDWSRYSPGRQIAAHAVRNAILEGASEFDWLQGDDRYKHEWTDLSRRDVRLIVGCDRRGAAWLGAIEAYRRGREAARRRLTPDSRRAMKDMLGRLQRVGRRFLGAPLPRSAEQATR